MKLGTLLIAPPPSASAMARLNRLRHQQVVLSAADSFNGEAADFSAAPHQQSYALMHVTGFIKHASSSLEAPLAVNEDGYSVPRSVTNFVVSLLGTSAQFSSLGAMGLNLWPLL